MTNLTVHNLEDDIRDGLKDLAVRHGRSIEDEAREILRGAVLAKRTSGTTNGNLGSRIAARFSSDVIEQDMPEFKGHSAVPPNLAR